MEAALVAEVELVEVRWVGVVVEVWPEVLVESLGVVGEWHGVGLEAPA